MIFSFENTNTLENFVRCPDINKSGIKRFTSCPIAVNIVYHRSRLGKIQKLQKGNEKYIISTGVNHSPSDWAENKISPFEFLPDYAIDDLRTGKAMVLFDQSLEGYQSTWLWEYFHTQCESYSIDPRSLIYVTGNLLAESQYKKWRLKNKESGINVISYVNFEADMYRRSLDLNINVNFQDHLTYKQSNDIKLHNCLQKRLRNHRIWLYYNLYQNDLITDSLSSMNKFPDEPSWMQGKSLYNDTFRKSREILPLLVYGKENTEFDDSYYIGRILKEVYLDTWVSIVSEASFADVENTIFLSEKIFKPIICRHPFIVFGNRGSLKKLRSLGYKTFDGFIDESYDDLPTFDRLPAVIESIKKIQQIKDKYSWFNSMQKILDHNYNTLRRNSIRPNSAFIKLNSCYKRYFRK